MTSRRNAIFALPSPTVFGGSSWSNGADKQVRSLANPLVRGSFASLMGKIGSPKNKLPLPAPTPKAHRIRG